MRRGLQKLDCAVKKNSEDAVKVGSLMQDHKRSKAESILKIDEMNKRLQKQESKYSQLEKALVEKKTTNTYAHQRPKTIKKQWFLVTHHIS